MSISVFDILHPLLLQHLRNMEVWLDKIEQHCQQQSVEPGVYLSARLHPEMFEFRRQLQIACDHAKGAMARLTGSELPTYPDNEQTTSELKQRIQKTSAFVTSFQRGDFTGAEERTIQLTYPWQTYDFNGLTYLHYWVLPNFLFHVNMAYAILRQAGLNIGKVDYLGPVPA